MKRTVSLLLAALLPLRAAVSQTEASFPQFSELRTWLDEHHSNFMSGYSAVNAAIVVIDTNAHIVKSIAFRLGANELVAWQGAVERAVGLGDDTVAKNLLAACVGRAAASPHPTRPICIQDGARVQSVDGLRFLAGRDVDVLKSDAASKRLGPDGTNGAVIVTTDSAAFERFASVGATPANFVSFEGRRMRPPAGGEPVVITILMLRGTP